MPTQFVGNDDRDGVFVHGPVAMLITPFLADWSLDLEGIKRVSKLALDQGATGLAVHGLASEGYKLLDIERFDIIEAVAAVNTTPLLVAGVDHEATHGSIALARSAAKAGATAVMAMPPKSTGGNRAKLIDYYKELELGGGLPIVIQDAPRASGIQMDPDTLLAIVSALELPNAIKVEDAIPPLKMAKLTAALPKDRRTFLYGGAGGRRFLSELHAGAIGTMVGPAYIDIFAHIQSIQTSDPREAAAAFDRCLALINAVEGNEWYALLQKQLCFRAGLISNPALRPPAVQADPAYMDGLVDIYLNTTSRQLHLGTVLNTMLNEKAKS